MESSAAFAWRRCSSADEIAFVEAEEEEAGGGGVLGSVVGGWAVGGVPGSAGGCGVGCSGGPPGCADGGSGVGCCPGGCGVVVGGVGDCCWATPATGNPSTAAVARVVVHLVIERFIGGSS